ncbi:SAV0927 family protein [Lentibacillus saliphilus]|uniref:SAV0927 family protein n=1 Tax=Lentibacillus saliphilus TaxID=2737028 RepID=UPI001C2FFBAE|nr:SAV0927 family protein [Lentibacillus saliphilus]
MDQSFDLIQDKTISKDVRYVSVMGNYKRYDFAFMPYAEDMAKSIVIDLSKNRYAILDQSDVEQRDIAHLFQVSGMEADELCAFLKDVL